MKSTGKPAATNVPNTASLSAIAEEQGWTDVTIIGLLTDYIDQQPASDAFEAYLRQRQAEENATVEDGSA